LRLGILPEGCIYPPAERPVRDMLRRRMLIVHQATQTLLSLQSMVTRHTSQSVSAAKLKVWTLQEVRTAFPDPYSQQTAAALLELLGAQRRIQHHLEKQVLAVVKLTGPFQRLVTIPGIGNILGITIALETGPIGRFAGAGQYASYCRTVNSLCTSAGKKKGENNRKNGNKYLAWAFVEAANFAQRYSPKTQAWFARKAARKGRVVAVKALACKLAKAAYYVVCATKWTSTSRRCLAEMVAATVSPVGGWLTTTRVDWEPSPPTVCRARGSAVLPASRASRGWTARTDRAEPES
jgi:transposase